MINITDKSKCCGCTACASICAHKAIIMEPDALGFLYPKVDINKCVECGLCEKVCAFNESYDKTLNLEIGPIAYAVRHKDMHQIETSRSGAAFIAFSDWVLEQGGVVYGVGYKDHFTVVHKRATTKEQRDEFKGSKYVQSDLGNVFLQVKEDLRNGLIVMFSGTPCQTSGLNSFIGKKLRKRLILVDIVCHGVPSPYVWRDNVNYIEKKYKSKLYKVNFRNKKFGWNTHIETYILNNNLEVKSTLFTKAYFDHIMNREACGKCYFSNINRPSDITLADFWGWENVIPDFNRDNKGCSLILCNTNKGITIFDIIKNSFDFIPLNIEDCLQPNLKKPSEINPFYNVFIKEYPIKGFNLILKRYSDNNLKDRIIILIKKIINKRLELILKK